MPVLASDAHAHAVANSGVSSDGNYGGMSSTVISALGTCHHSAIMGCWDGTAAEGEGGLERGPRLPTGDQYMSLGWSPCYSGILAWQRSQKESSHALFHTSWHLQTAWHTQACADRECDHMYTRYSPRRGATEDLVYRTEGQTWQKWEHLSQDTVKMWPRSEDERGEPHSGFSGARTNKECLLHSSEWTDSPTAPAT